MLDREIQELNYRTIRKEEVISRWGNQIENVELNSYDLFRISRDIFFASGGIPWPNKDRFSIQLPQPLPEILDKTFTVMLSESDLDTTVKMMETLPPKDDGHPTYIMYYIHPQLTYTRTPHSGRLSQEEVQNLTKSVWAAFINPAQISSQTRSNS